MHGPRPAGVQAFGSMGLSGGVRAEIGGMITAPARTVADEVVAFAIQHSKDVGP